MKVTELIDILYKCKSDAQVRIAIEDDVFDCWTSQFGVIEVENKLNDEPPVVYLTHP